MIVLCLLLGAAFLAATLHSAEVEAALIPEVLGDIEGERGYLAAYLAASLMIKGAEWWEV